MSSVPRAGKVLVVDDDEMYLKLTARLLRGAGYDVVTRSDVIGTSVAVKSERPDLVLIDLNMPLINGDRLVPLIRRARTDPPFIVLYSGIDAVLLEQRAADCGADTWIQKGHAPSRFLERIADCFKRAAAVRAVRSSP
jgi:DNA-binding response OmpR family regulator